MIRKISILTMIAAAALAVGCEQAQEDETVAEHIENAGEEMSAAAEDVRNDMEDACEEMKEEAGAEDTNC